MICRQIEQLTLRVQDCADKNKIHSRPSMHGRWDQAQAHGGIQEKDNAKTEIALWCYRTRASKRLDGSRRREVMD